VSLAQSEKETVHASGIAQGQQMQAQSTAQTDASKVDHHLHETSIRVDPPFSESSKKSIAEAEKALEDAKTSYDKMKATATDEELKF